MTYPQPPGDPNQQPYGAPAQPDQPAQPYGAPDQPYGVPAQPYGAPDQPYGVPAQPAQPYGADQPAQPYGAPPAYPTGPNPMYPPADMPPAPSQPMYPPTYPPQYAPPGVPAAPSQPMYPPNYPPGYASPSMPMYQQPQPPQQPYPYGAQPGMQPGMRPAGAGAMNFALLTQPRQRGFFIAGIAAILAILLFFIPGFYEISAQALGFTISGLGPLPNLSGAGFGAYAVWIWLVPVCVLAGGGMAIWQAVNTRPDTPTGLNRRNTAIIAAALGGIAVVLLLVAFAGAAGYCDSVLGPAAASFGAPSSELTCRTYSAGTSISGGYGFTFWLLLLAAAGTAVGGILQINTKP